MTQKPINIKRRNAGLTYVNSHLQKNNPAIAAINTPSILEHNDLRTPPHIQLNKLEELFTLSLSEPTCPVSHVYYSYTLAGVSAHLNKEVENV